MIRLTRRASWTTRLVLMAFMKAHRYWYETLENVENNNIIPSSLTMQYSQVS